MPTEHEGTVEALPTLTALVRLVAGVNAVVRDQAGMLGESKSTDLALELLETCSSRIDRTAPHRKKRVPT